MVKHTPGPWHASPTHMGADFDIGAANGDNIALVHGPLSNGADEFKANAALIAVAPALLSALRNAVAAIERLTSEDLDAVMAARLAIAKAETP